MSHKFNLRSPVPIECGLESCLVSYFLFGWLKSHSTLFPNCHEEVMYGSVDNSWNDCINEKNLIVKNKGHVCDRIDAGELKS